MRIWRRPRGTGLPFDFVLFLPLSLEGWSVGHFWDFYAPSTAQGHFRANQHRVKSHMPSIMLSPRSVQNVLRTGSVPSFIGFLGLVTIKGPWLAITLTSYYFRTTCNLWTNEFLLFLSPFPPSLSLLFLSYLMSSPLIHVAKVDHCQIKRERGVKEEEGA